MFSNFISNIISNVLSFIGLPFIYSSLPSTKSVDAVIVLGSTVTVSGQPGFGLQRRLEHSIELSNKFVIKGIVLSGNGIETNAMYIFIREHISTNIELVLDRESNNTRQNAFFSSQIMRSKNWNSAIVVSSPYHLKRAVKEFEKYDICVYGSPAFASSEYPLRSHLKAVSHEYISFIKNNIWKM